jgi:hypothetical protein
MRHRAPRGGMRDCYVNRETLKSMLIPTGAALLFLLWGMGVYFSVGDKGPPSWDFGVVEDVPGASKYSTDDGRPLNGISMPLEKQHVDGRNEE